MGNNSLKNNNDINNFFRDYLNYMNSTIEYKLNNSTKLLDRALNIKPKENEKIKYYYSLGYLYDYKSKKDARQYNFSDGITFDINEMTNESKRNYLEEIIKNKKLSIEYYNKANEILKEEKYDLEFKIKVKEDIDDGIRVMTQDLCFIYYAINDEENFLKYGKDAIQYNSLNAIYVFIKYYCDKLDYNNAYKYYNLMKDFDVNRLKNSRQDEKIKQIYSTIELKVASYLIYLNFLYDSEIYEDSLKIAQELKKFVANNNYIDNKINIIKPINEKITECEKMISKSKKALYNEEILTKYFSKEILQIMSDDNKIYISTSLNIYEYMKSCKTTMDYSATLMPILKAIENIIFEIMGKAYHNYINQKRKNGYKLNYGQIKPFFDIRNNSFIEEIKQLEFGAALKLIGYIYHDPDPNVNEDTFIKRSYFKEFCISNGVKDCDNVITKLYTELDILRQRRNLVAHKNRVYEECVKECYDILLNNIQFINFLYTNFEFVFKSKEDTKD